MEHVLVANLYQIGGFGHGGSGDLGGQAYTLVDLLLYPSSSSTCLETTRTFYSVCTP